MKGDVHNSVRRSLAKRHACYILITCDQPTGDGAMNVQMSYEGDAVLASFLLDGAQNQIDQEAWEASNPQDCDSLASLS